MIVCSYQLSSEHSTSLGRVRYERCICGRFRVLLDSEVLIERCPKICSRTRSYLHGHEYH